MFICQLPFVLTYQMTHAIKSAVSFNQPVDKKMTVDKKHVYLFKKSNHLQIIEIQN